MFEYKMNVIEELNKKGYTHKVLYQNAILPDSSLQKFRLNIPVNLITINKVCQLLNCQPSDILEYTPD